MSIGLIVEIIGDSSKLAKELDKSEKGISGFAGGIGGTAVKIAAVAGVAAVAATAIADMTTAAVEDAAEQDRLTAALEAAGVAHGDYAAQVDEAIAAGQARAFSDTQTREALMSLVTATGDLNLATQDLTVAQDLARFANVDLATAADAVAKAHAGQDGALRKLMPGLEKGADANATLAAATAKAAGQADKYASSAAGMQDIAGDAFGELSETIGSVFIPILQEVLPVLIPIIKEIGKLITALLPVLIPLIRVLGSVLGVAVRVLGKVVGWLIDLVTWAGNAADAVGDFLESINPLKGVKLPSLPFTTTASPSSAGVGARGVSPMAAAPLAGATIQIFTTGDGIEAEQAVVRAIRRVSRINGGLVLPANGWQSS